MSLLRKATDPFSALGVGPQPAPPESPTTPSQPAPVSEPAGTTLAQAPLQEPEERAPDNETRTPGARSLESARQPRASRRDTSSAQGRLRPPEAPSSPDPEPAAKPLRTERVQVNVTRRIKLLLQFEDMERQSRRIRARDRDETTLVAEAIEKAYGHLWAKYGHLFTDGEA